MILSRLVIPFILVIAYSGLAVMDDSSLDFSRLIHRYLFSDELADWGSYLLLDVLIFLGNGLGLHPRFFYFFFLFFPLFIFFQKVSVLFGSKILILFSVLFLVLIPPSDFIHLLKQNISSILFCIALLCHSQISRLMFFFIGIGIHFYLSLFVLFFYLVSIRISKRNSAIKFFFLGLVVSGILLILKPFVFVLQIVESFGISFLSYRVLEYSTDRWGSVNFWFVVAQFLAFSVLYLMRHYKDDGAILTRFFVVGSGILMVGFSFSGMDILVYRFLVYSKIVMLLAICVALRRELRVLPI